MAVSKHKNSPNYSFKIYLPGFPRPFRGSTGEKTKRRAEQFEATKRAELIAQHIHPALARPNRLPPMTLADAVGRFYEEKVEFVKNRKTAFGQLNRLLDGLGEATYLHHLTTDELTTYQTERRKDGVANRTINAEVPELISRMFTRAKMWRVDLGEPIDWRSLKLPIPRHRVRAATRPEEVKLLRALRLDYRPIIRFALITGLRRSALLLKRDQLDWGNMILHYPKKSKYTDDIGWLPITPPMAAILLREISKGGDDSEWVFTYRCRRGRGERVKGERYPVTPAGLKEAMVDAVKASGLKDWRLLHDLRHTAATRTLRNSQNLAAVQQMLGHSDIGQTSRYAHVLLDDLRLAMSTPSVRPTAASKPPLDRSLAPEDAT